MTHSSGRTDGAPDLRIIHYNDVYHVEPGSREPVGGVARFQTLCNDYAKGERFAGQPDVLTLFSGDAFNPSLESSVTKGMIFLISIARDLILLRSEHMVNYRWIETVLTTIITRQSYGSILERHRH